MQGIEWRIKLTTVKLPGETVYFVNGKMASVEFGPAGLVIQKIDGKGVSLIAGNKQVTLDEMVSSLSLATRVIRRLLILLHLQPEKSQCGKGEQKGKRRVSGRCR